MVSFIPAMSAQPAIGGSIKRRKDVGAKPSIDHEQVCTMIETGFGDKHIAKRLGISAKQVQRIRIKYGIQRGPHIGSLLNTPDEYVLWKMWFIRLNHNYSAVAYRFGISRQAVFERLNQREAA